MLGLGLPSFCVGLDLGVWAGFARDVMRSAVAILPSAVLWGAAFPLALACVAGENADSGKVVGGVYAANTVGAIVGSIAFSLVFIPGIGTQHSEQILLSLAVMAAFFAWKEPKLTM